MKLDSQKRIILVKINKVGKLGEIRTDHITGVRYKCVSRYTDSMGNVDCDWAVVVNEPEKVSEPEAISEHDEEIESEKIPEEKIPENKMEDEPVKDVAPRHTNYNKQYRKNRH